MSQAEKKSRTVLAYGDNRLEPKPAGIGATTAPVCLRWLAIAYTALAEADNNVSRSVDAGTFDSRDLAMLAVKEKCDAISGVGFSAHPAQ